MDMENRLLSATWPASDGLPNQAVVLRERTPAQERALAELEEKYNSIMHEAERSSGPSASRVLDYASRAQIQNNRLSRALVRKQSGWETEREALVQERNGLLEQLNALRREKDDMARALQDELESATLLLQEEARACVRRMRETRDLDQAEFAQDLARVRERHEHELAAVQARAQQAESRYQLMSDEAADVARRSRAEVDAAERRALAAESRIAPLQGELEVRTRRVNEQASQLRVLEGKLAEAESALRFERSRLESEHAQVIKELRVAVDKAEARSSGLASEIERLREEHARLVAAIDARASLAEANLAGAEAEVRALSRRVAQREDDLLQASSQAQQRTQSAQEAEARAEETKMHLDAWMTKANDAGERVTVLEEQLVALNAAHAAAAAAAEEEALAAAESKIETLPLARTTPHQGSGLCKTALWLVVLQLILIFCVLTLYPPRHPLGFELRHAWEQLQELLA